MTKDFFFSQIERMGRAWSAPNEEFQQILWSKVKHLGDDQLERAVGFLIGEHTVKSLPPMSRFEAALALFRPAVAPGEVPPIEPKCLACQDQGYGIVEGLLEACSCETGKHLKPDEVARLQGAYDRGRKLFRSPFDKDPPPPSGERIFKPLPYDPKKRQGA